MIAIIIAVVVIVAIVAFVYFHTTSTLSLHTIIWGETTLYSGNIIPPVSSDGVDNVLIGTSNGIFLFTIADKKGTKINTSIATGLAYDGTDFMMLEADGTLSSIDLDGTKAEIAIGYTRLYDTVDGYLTTISGITSVTGENGSTISANGNYGSIQLKIK